MKPSVLDGNQTTSVGRATRMAAVDGPAPLPPSGGDVIHLFRSFHLQRPAAHVEMNCDFPRTFFQRAIRHRMVYFNKVLFRVSSKMDWILDFFEFGCGISDAARDRGGFFTRREAAVVTSSTCSNRFTFNASQHVVNLWRFPYKCHGNEAPDFLNKVHFLEFPDFFWIWRHIAAI